LEKYFRAPGRPETDPFPHDDDLGRSRVHHHAIMRELWIRGEATVAEVHKALEHDRGLALTTIATMLKKMEVKGVVKHRSVGRQYVYRALVREKDVHRRMVADLTERLFRGDVAALVNHLISEQEIDADELSRLRELIEQREREERGHA
jgi:predicted transcriptional regulator